MISQPPRPLKIGILKLDNFDESLPLPSYKTEGASGADIRACFVDKENILIAPFERVLIPTGLAVELPRDIEIQIRPRSGLSLKTSLMVLNSPGTIDADYRGEIKILLGNLGQTSVTIKHGDRIAQWVLSPVLQGNFTVVKSISETKRGAGGFGHTGRN